jgi:hypothetical protein
MTRGGAGASHGLIARSDALASRPGRQLTYSVGWERAERSVPGRQPVSVNHQG